jgi:Protein of unknown function (DUF1553)/Protein of unknown function (DUF1549)
MKQAANQCWILWVAGMCLWHVTAGTLPAAIRGIPAEVHLDRPEATSQLLVLEKLPDGRERDITRAVRYEITPAPLAGIDGPGLVRPLADGTGQIIIRHGTEELRIPVTVQGYQHPQPVSFQYDLMPIVTKARCNSGGCHGKAEGQNGFKLSIFGFDPEADYKALFAEARGRRISLSNPDQSLLLRKAIAELPHGGGRKIEKNSAQFALLRRWITEGAAFTAEGEGPVVGIAVEPAQITLLAGESQQLRVTAVTSGGVRRCVTIEAEYDSNAANIAAVDPRGLVDAGETPGEAAILVRYLGHVAVARVTLPRPGGSFRRPLERNFIDRLAWDKLQHLGIQPSDEATDAQFLRRMFLDLIGTLPSADEARRFLADAAPDKRARMIDALLQRREYVDYWTMRWADLLRADQLTITPAGAVAMTRWLRKQISGNRPYDEFVREIVTAGGNTLAESPAAFFKAYDTPETVGRSISQLFLGVRIECAQCHHHPSEKWGQADYFGFAGFFTGVTRKPLPTGGEAILSRAGSDLKHPRTEEVIAARALGAEPADFSRVTDRRQVLADWMISPANPYFTRMIVNRLWAHYFGQGLVTPIDDLRATNPATNEPLLEALCQHMRDVKYDLKAWTRTVLNSRLYQSSPETNETNALDRQNFSHALDKALPAEVLLDMVCQTTGATEKFNGWPEGYRAIELWDSRVPNYFFRIFGRPSRTSVCECERSNEPSIAQALHLLNSPEVTEKIQDPHGTARKLANSARTPAEIVDEIFLTALSRFPRDNERQLLLATFAEEPDRRTAVEDVLWTVMNMKEFLYNR